jgi:hypothetical protein
MLHIKDAPVKPLRRIRYLNSYEMALTASRNGRRITKIFSVYVGMEHS